MFVQFRDGSGDIQGVIEKKEVGDKIWQIAEELTQESSLQLTGIVKEDDRAPSGF